MITERDLNEAIAECIGKRDPNANDCIKLAAFYTIRDQLYPQATVEAMPSFSAAPPPSSDIDFPGESEFAMAIDGRRQDEIWPVMDELMMTLETINPRLYNAVLRKLR